MQRYEKKWYFQRIQAKKVLCIGYFYLHIYKIYKKNHKKRQFFNCFLQLSNVIFYKPIIIKIICLKKHKKHEFITLFFLTCKIWLYQIKSINLHRRYFIKDNGF